MPRTIYIPVEGPIVISDEEPSFKDLQQYVGGFVQREYVPVSVLAAASSGIPLEEVRTMVLICNEDGRLRKMPVNNKATLLLWDHFRYGLIGDIVILDGFDI